MDGQKSQEDAPQILNQDLEVEHPYQHSIESLNRRKAAEEEYYNQHGRIQDKEIDAVLLKLFQSRRGYLFDRLKSILDKRDPYEAEQIRTQYIRMAQEMEAEQAAQAEEDREKGMDRNKNNYDKMLRFLENYTRVQESQNLKKHQTL